MTAPIAFAHRLQTGFAGYYGYWRFSEARSVQCATSDREIAGGMNSTRCLPTSRS
ncbi:hypothetical protein [Billgrantia gudaonensis]|uniref:Uncharacterized protein n=1 Tax=Billgrantia gudaonensis TaxID=376427 RepID=A0A1G8RN26_9GAMM|nr:hypothetical protein [Halomonas gudaonensis]SDJ18349.1 hypothetical protein SAMN04487954_103270 [Halomonas gudaonensis]